MAELATAGTALIEGLDADAVAALAGDEPAWLRDRRLAAWQVFEDTPLPTTKLEEWRYTDVRLLKLDQVRLAEPGAPADVPAQARALVGREKQAGARALLLGPDLAVLELSSELRRQGVILSDLSAAAFEHAELVEPHLATRAVPPEAGKFAALNAAVWAGGIFLYVPRGVHLELPVRVAHWLAEPGVAIFPRTLIIADEGSQVAYIDEFASPDFEAPALACGAVEVYARAGARVQYVALQRWGQGVRHLSVQRTLAGRDANLDSLQVNLGASLARVELSAQLEGPGARSDMLGLYFARGDQHFDHNTRQDHAAPHANSDLLYKGALYDQAHAVFRGVIRVHRGAQRTDAYQTNRNLLLSAEARADSQPNLEIEADDVRCSHAATVGQLDQEELFYLMSRGLSRKAAERLVIFGFFAEVLERLPLPGVVEELRAVIEEKIG